MLIGRKPPERMHGPTRIRARSASTGSLPLRTEQDKRVSRRSAAGELDAPRLKVGSSEAVRFFLSKPHSPGWPP